MGNDQHLAIEQDAIKASGIFGALPSLDNEARCVRDVDSLNVAES